MTVEQIGTAIRFNGAATLVSRKGRPCTRGPSRRTLLQWGRDFSVAEGGEYLALLLGEGCFNGAATLVSRKGVRPAHDRLGRRIASMGPRL